MDRVHMFRKGSSRSGPVDLSGGTAESHMSSYNPRFAAGFGPERVGPMSGNGKMDIENAAWDGGPLQDEDAERSSNCCKRTFCETRRRRLICFTISVFVLSLLTFFGVRVSQALDIVNTKPLFRTVGMDTLCTNKFTFAVDGMLKNPSAVGATIGQSSSKISTVDGVVAIINIPEIEVKSGDHDVDVQGDVEICDECIVPLRKTIQRWLDGSKIDYKVNLDLAASFDASVFLFPFTFSTTMEIESFLEPFVDLTLTREQREAIALELAMKGYERIKSVKLASADNTTVVGMLGLNMTSQETDAQKQKRLEQSQFGDFKILAKVPALTYVASIDGKQAAMGASKPFTFGDANDVLYASAIADWDSVDPINQALVLYQSLSTIPFSLSPVYNASLLDDPAAEECFLQTLMEGISINTDVEFFQSVVDYTEQQTKNDPTLAELIGATINSINQAGIIDITADLDLLGTQQFYEFEGELPSGVTVELRVNSSSADAREDIGTLNIVSGISINQTMDSLVNDISVNIDVDNATLVTRFVTQAAGLVDGFTPFVFGQVVPDRLLTALFSSFVIEIPFNEEITDVVTTTRRRVLQQQDDGETSKAVIDLTLDVQASYLQLDLVIQNLSKADLLGYELVFDAFEFIMATKYPFTNPSAAKSDFFRVSSTAVDLQTKELDDLTIGLRIFDDSFGGSLINDLISYVFEDYSVIELFIRGTYGGQPIGEGENLFQFPDWDALRPGEATPSQPIDGKENRDLVEFKHVEIERIVNNEIFLGTYFGINFADYQAELTLTPLHIGVADCSKDLADPNNLVSISTDTSIIKVGASDQDLTIVPVTIDLVDTVAEDVLTTAARFLAGNQSTVCIVKHPTKSNFFSTLIAAFQISFTVEGLSDEQVDGAGDVASSSVLDLEIVTDTTSVCTDVSVNLTEANQYWNTSVGWGALEWELREKNTNDLFFSWQAPSAFVGGTCDSAFASVGHCEQNLVDFTFCLKTDNSNVVTGASIVRQTLEALLIDQSLIPVRLSGYSTNRRDTGQGQFPISGSFDIPKDTLSILQGTVSEETKSSFELDKLVKHFEILELVNTRLEADIQPADGEKTFQGVKLTVPPLKARIFGDDGSTQETILSFNAVIPQQTETLEAQLTVTLASWSTFFDSFVSLRDNSAYVWKLGRDLSGTRFLDRIIPDVDLSSETTETVVEKTVSLELTSTSTGSSTTLRFFATALNGGPLPFPLKWSGDSILLYDGVSTSNAIGTLTLPGATFGPTDSTTGNIDLILSGSFAEQLATNLFKGSDVSLGIQTTTSSRFDVQFTLPKELLEAVALGTSGASTGASDSIDLNEIAIVGGDDAGSDIVLPCLVSQYCKNLLIDESTQTYTGVSLGLNFNLPDLNSNSSIAFKINLQNDLDIDVIANGLPIGELTIRAPFTLDSTKTGLGNANAYSGVIRFKWDPTDGVETARFTIDRVSSSDSLVLSLNGATAGTSSTYLSKLLSGIEQDIFIDSKAADPNAPNIVDAVDLSVLGAVPQELTLLAAAQVNYLDGPNDIGVAIPLGTINLDIYRNEQRVASAAIEANQPDGRSFTLMPTSTTQAVNVIGKAYRDSANGPLTAAMNDLVTKFVFSADIPLRIAAQFTPSSDFGKYNAACTSNPTSNGCTFMLTTWLTNPKQDVQSEFIDSFSVNLGSSAWDIVTSADAQFSATKVLYNSLPFPIIVSYFQYKIVLYDTAGTYTEGYDAFFSGDCTAGFSPCNNNVPGFEYCYNPYDDVTYPGRKKNIIENDGLLQVGDSLRPAKSLTGGALQPEGTGAVDLTVNPLSEDMARLYEQYEFQKRLCADITNGNIVIGIQSGTCSDNDSTLVDNLQCTFPLDLDFEMLEYGLLDGDTCRGPLGSQEDLNNPVSLNSGYAYNTVTNFFASTGSTKWSNTQVPIIDAFQIEIRIAFGSSGDDIEIVFSPDKSEESTALQLLTRDCNQVKVKGKEQRSRPVLYQSGEGKTTTIFLTFDAYTKRIRFQVAGGKGEYSDFDFDPQVGGLANANKAWIGIKHSTSSSTISTRTIRFTKVDGAKTSLVATDKGDNNINPIANTVGYLTFQTRDTQGRRKGTGGDSWTVSILSALNGSTAPTNTVTVAQAQANACQGVSSGKITCTSVACVCDLDNGTYRVAYSIQTRGRYIFSVSSPTVSTNANSPVTLTERVYVRSP